MPNELKFELEFTRQQMQEILDNESTKYVIVSGTYSYPGMGATAWNMEAEGVGCDTTKEKLTVTKKVPCIKPC